MVNNKGLYLDCEPIDQPPGTWRDARNILISKIKGVYTNEDGATYATASGYPGSNAEPIGVGVFPNKDYVVFTAGKNGGKDRLGIVSGINAFYIDLIVDDIMNFSTDFPIRSAEVDYNFKGERIVAWTDRNNSSRILNIDNLPFALNPDKSLVTPSNWGNTEIFPKFKAPIISFTISDSGGAIPAGNYSLAIAYENIDGTRTPNSIPIKNINIVDDSKANGFNLYDGVIPGSLTSKSITITINNVDTNYDRLVLIVVYKANNQVVAKEIKKADISGTTLTTTYIGTETTTTLNLEEVLAIRPLYSKTGCLTQLNSVLYHADLESEDDIEYQQYANNIKIFYNTKLVDIDDLDNSHKTSFPAGFAHGGVYAFNIHLVLRNGSISRGFHIPGRAPQSTDLELSTVASNAGLPNTTQKYQIENTTDIGNPAYMSLLDGTRCVSNTAGMSNMGYWHNKDEQYPAGFPSLTGRVRHHVFPSIRKCRAYHYIGETRYSANKLDILGIDVTNVVIPSELQSRVEGWIISYAKRDYVNSNVLGNDLLLMAHSVDTDSSRIWWAGGNWNVDAKQESGDGDSNWGDDLNMRFDYARGHNFDLLRDKPQINSSSLYIDTESSYLNHCTNQAYKDIGIDGCNLAASGNGEGQNAGGLIDFRALSNIDVLAIGTNNQRIRRITDLKYLPNGVIDGNIWTIKNEETISYKIEADMSGIIPTKVRLNSSGRTAGNLFSEASNPEITELLTFKQVRDNLFANYDQQILIMTDTICLKSDTSKRAIRGGDTFLSLRSFISSCPRYAADISGTDGFSIIRAHIVEGKYNVGLRYEVLGKVNSQYYPKTPPTEFWTNPDNPDSDGTTMIFSRFSNINEPEYSEDYNATNNLTQTTIFSPNQITTTKFPYRVIKSGVSGSNSQSLNSWKTYLSTDYYESNRNRGRIENITTIDDVLLIHHLYGLFRTLNTERLSLGSTEVFLGTGDIFSQQPKEPISTKLGYLGNQNIFASFTFKGTYAWTDQSQGRIFTINKQGVNELSTKGLFNYFRDNLGFKTDYGNTVIYNDPIVGNCIIGGYDPKYNRLIFTKHTRGIAQPSFTLSYSVDDGCWVSFHDYTPNIYFNTTTELFGLSSGFVWRFNDLASKGKYLGGAVYSSYIDIVYNFRDERGEPIDTHFFNVNWVSEIKSSNGTILRDKTITHLTARNSYQTMSRVALIPHTTFGISNNIRRKLNKWNFNKIKVSNSNPLNRKPLVDKYCIVRYEYDNAINLDDTQNSLYLYLLSVNVKETTV
jgi:hypothetical protein